MLRKYATTTVLDAQVAHPRSGMIHDAHKVVFEYEPRVGYLYARSRAISSRCNDNWDYFGPEEIAKSYRSFIGRPVFTNHRNEDHRRARGVIIDAALHEDRNPDGSPDTWVEALHEIDAQTFPKFAKAILNGDIDRTSMGVDVEQSKCVGHCGNIATNPAEYCSAIPGKKGTKIWRFTASGARRPSLIYESCVGLTFFENSFLVEPPADPTAVVMRDISRGPGLEHFGPRTASLQRTASVTPPPRERIVVPERRLRAVQGSRCTSCHSDQTLTAEGLDECFDCGNIQVHGALQVEADFDVEAVKYENPGDHPWFAEHPVHSDNIVDHWNRATPEEKEQGARWYPDAHLVAKGMTKLGQGHSMHQTAGMLANYSPQQGWEGNMHNAARVLQEGKGIGGKGSGMFATAQQRNTADHILNGESYNDLIKGPKVRAFAHLIEHGGDEDPENPHVVIDRHALSVAHGRPLPAHDYTSAPMQGNWRKDGSLNSRYYDHVVGAYHNAAKQIGEQEGHPVAPHQVQATTWLTRQRLNGEQGYEGRSTENLDTGRENARANRQHAWEQFAEDYLPDLKGPGTGYKPKYANPADHPTYQAYQPSVANIVHHFDSATPEERQQGMNWYSDAHHLAKAMGEHTGHDARTAAGLISAYSPQMAWHSALHNATRSLVNDEPVKRGQGAYVMNQHEQAAKKIMAGEHHQAVLKGPRSQDLAHLIEHGGRNPQTGEPSNRVSLGHQALSVAAGMPFDDDDEKESRKVLGNRHYYNHLGDLYRAAANHLSQREGTEIAPHQVQAVTGLVRDGMDSEDSGLFPRDTAEKKNVRRYVEQNVPGTEGHPHLSRKQAAISPELKTLHSALQRHGLGKDDFFARRVTSPISGSGVVYGGPLHPEAGRSLIENKDSIENDTAGAGYPFWVRPAEDYRDISVHSDPELRFYGDPEGLENHNRQRSDEYFRQRQSMRHRAYGETKAPADVDTLRDESCPVCGSDTSAWDGNRCRICGWNAPPKAFRDPDLDLASQIDMRKQPIDPDNPTGPQDVDLDSDEVDPEEQPDLVCDNCGATFEEGQPLTTPEEPDEPTSTGPEEGETCPACGEGELVPPDALEEGPDVAPDEEDDDTADSVDPSDFEPSEDEEDQSEEPDEDAESGEEDDEEEAPPAKKSRNPFKKGRRKH
jgi:hypothetical protein